MDHSPHQKKPGGYARDADQVDFIHKHVSFWLKVGLSKKRDRSRTKDGKTGPAQCQIQKKSPAVVVSWGL